MVTSGVTAVPDASQLWLALLLMLRIRGVIQSITARASDGFEPYVRAVSCREGRGGTPTGTPTSLGQSWTTGHKQAKLSQPVTDMKKPEECAV